MKIRFFIPLLLVTLPFVAKAGDEAQGYGGSIKRGCDTNKQHVGKMCIYKDTSMPVCINGKTFFSTGRDKYVRCDYRSQLQDGDEKCPADFRLLKRIRGGPRKGRAFGCRFNDNGVVQMLPGVEGESSGRPCPVVDIPIEPVGEDVFNQDRPEAKCLKPLCDINAGTGQCGVGGDAVEPNPKCRIGDCSKW